MEGTLIFTRKGYASVSLKEPAERVGVDLAMIYEHFPGKEILWKNGSQPCRGSVSLIFPPVGRGHCQSGQF